MNLKDLRDPLHALVCEAETEVLALRRKFLATGVIGTEAKDDKSPVTDADRLAHEILNAGLHAIHGVPVVSEEGHHSAANAHEYWLIDPVDGTKEFLKGRDEWTINIALIRNGRPVAGFVSAPVLCEYWWGVPGVGAEKRASSPWVQIHSAPLTGKAVRAVVSVSHRGPDVDRYIERVEADDYQISEASYGSSLKICRVAEGAADVYPRLGPTSEWDTAAADAVIHGAGGQLTDAGGRALTYGKSNPLNPFFIAGCPGLDWTRYVG